MNTASLSAGTKIISVSAVDNRGNVSTDLVEIRLDVVPFSVNFVTQTVTDTATNTTITPTASPYVITGASNEYYSALRPFTVEIGGIDPSTLKSLDWQLQLDDGSAPVSVSETLVATTEQNGQEGSVAASLTYTQSFEFSSTGTLTVTATNTSDVVVQNSLTVFIDLPEPDEDLTDFINYIYKQVQGAVPSAVSVGALIDGEQYEIVTPGTTDFTTLGAADSNVGTIFTYNGTAGTGTGTVLSEVIAAKNTIGVDTPANRAAFAATLFPSDQYNDSRYQTVALVYKTLTGQWPTQAQLESGLDTILQNSEAQSDQTILSQEGSIEAGATQVLTFNYSQGDEVTIIVNGIGTSGPALTDPTLTVRAPDGSYVGFSDDSFASRNPSLSFTANQTGAYTATVGGYFTFQSGGFVATSTATSSVFGSNTLAARALVESLKGSYNGADGFLADTATASSSAAAFVAQIYQNKHELGIMTYNSSFLGGRLRGVDTVRSTGDTIPGYQSNVVNFVADFAIDVDLTTGPYASVTSGDGYPYSKIIYYGRPNNPLSSWDQARAQVQSGANLRYALSALLGIQNPTAIVYTFTPPTPPDDEVPVNRTLNEFMALTLEVALAEIFASNEFAAQFSGDTASSDTDGDGFSNYEEVLLGTDPDDSSIAPTALDLQVALYMLSLGVDDGDKVALDDDADSDGVSNYVEFLLDTDPSDGSLAPSAADSFVAQRMVDFGVVDPTMIEADDDADGDGVSNIEEILLNTSPSNINDEPTASGSSSTDGTDFVFEFVQLKSSLMPIGASVVVECADETFTFVPVSAVDLQTNLSLSADQTGITSDYERVEYRVETSSIGCSFFRLSAQ
ncbi:MAG: thrombospondin type 3 repeat-containing protein [Verrucomicrobiota bacterium]|nr:thrombospondin type 3 repeat-containing protein [Verrucomicrobiota bacterium]